MKYYWYSFSYNNAGGRRTYSEGVLNIHPFARMDIHRGSVSGSQVVVNYALHNWKEITENEYNLFIEINK